MIKQILSEEFRRMQKLAGIITEDEEANAEQKLKALREDAFGSDKAIPLSQIPDAAAKAAVSAGTKDKSDNDDAANAGEASVAVGSLKPMQKEVIPEKALSFALGFADTGNTPDLDNMEAITSADGYIMDGHHRWAARTLLNPGAAVKVSKVDMPADDVVTALNIYTKARGLKGNPGKGDVTQFAALIPKAIDAFVSQGTDQWPMSKKKPEEIKAIIAKIGGGDFEKGKATLIANAKKLPTAIHPNAPSRVDMPVIDAAKGDLKKVLTKLKAGDIDFKEPYAQSTKFAMGKKEEPVKENKMKDLIRMNQLAGTITEGQARKIIAILNEAEDFKVDGTYTANTQTIMSDLKNEKEGVYVLKGGLEKNGRWNEDSLQKGEPVYYTTDTTDPKLKSFQEDGMVWVTIENGEMEVTEY